MLIVEIEPWKAPIIRTQQRGANSGGDIVAQGKGIKTICRDLMPSKTRVRQAIRTGMAQFTYSQTVQPGPKLSAWPGS